MPFKDPAKRAAYQLAWQRDHRAECRGYNKRQYRKNRDSLLARMRAKYEKAPTAACTICNSVERLYWDHDHATGRFRGWLCMSCNFMLGQGHDLPWRLRAGAEYLETHASTPDAPAENTARSPATHGRPATLLELLVETANELLRPPLG